MSWTRVEFRFSTFLPGNSELQSFAQSQQTNLISNNSASYHSEVQQLLQKLTASFQIEATTARECPYVIILSFRLQAYYNPTPCPMKLTCRYLFYVELYSGVVLFSLIFWVKPMTHDQQKLANICWPTCVGQLFLACYMTQAREKLANRWTIWPILMMKMHFSPSCSYGTCRRIQII